MYDFNIAELDEIHYLVKAYGYEKNRTQEQIDLHKSIIEKVNRLTAEIFDNLPE